MPRPDVYLTRARANLSEALAQGAQPRDAVLAVLLVTRGLNTAGPTEHADADELLELLTTLNGFRATAPGQVTP